MELNYGMNNPKSMKDVVSTLFESADKLLSVHCKLNEIAMGITQSIGYNGFKRWHRYRSKEFHKLKLKMENILIDEFRITPTVKEYELTYTPSSLEEHLRSWESALLDGVENVGNLYKQYYDTVGRCNKPLEEFSKILITDYKKVGRLITRFTESDWLAIDMHMVDDNLHRKYKELEHEHC